MSQILQQYLARQTTKTVADLETALLRLPADKRNWQPEATSRSALDQVAEVAILSGITAQVVAKQAFPEGFDFAAYGQEKEALAADWPACKALLDKNTAAVTAAIGQLSDADLGVTVLMPWGPMTLEQIIGYPYWNASYHEGQINYIASLLGCLD